MIRQNELPITTATMARLYFKQGKLDQAEVLYRKLLQETPNQTKLAQELNEVIKRKQNLQPAVSADQLNLQLVQDALKCNWSISDQGISRAQMLLKAKGDLVLRIITFPPENHHNQQKTTDLKLQQNHGLMNIPLLKGAQLAVAAVGLLGQDGRFISIVHCNNIDLRSTVKQQ